jgi:hypothetical protein
MLQSFVRRRRSTSVHGVTRSLPAQSLGGCTPDLCCTNHWTYAHFAGIISWLYVAVMVIEYEIAGVASSPTLSLQLNNFETDSPDQCTDTGATGLWGLLVWLERPGVLIPIGCRVQVSNRPCKLDWVEVEAK